MKRIILSIAAVSMLASVLNATCLREAVVQTIDANPDILLEKFNKEAFKKYIDQEKGDYLPTLDFEAYADKSKTKYDLDSNPSQKDGKKGGWNTSLKLEQVIYDGGLTPSEVEEFEHKYYANRFRSDAKVEGIIRGSIDSYLDLIKSQELMNLSKLNIERHEDYLKTAQEKESISGEILESYQVNSKKHFIIDRYLEQEDEKTNANDKYKRFTHHEIQGNICRPVINEEMIPNTLEKVIELSMSKNYKVLEQVEKVKEQRENIVQENAAYLPTLKFQLQSSWDDDLINPENGREDTQRARLILNWNLFNGFKTKDAKQRETLFLKEQQKQLDSTTSAVSQDITIAYNSYKKAKQKIENSKKFVADNKNIKDVYVKQLADGTRTFIDILNAESELYRSQITLLDQEFTLYKLYYDLLEQTGLLSESILMTKNQTCKIFIPTKYESKIKKVKNTDSELKDSELLNVLGESTKNDEEINNIINGTENKDKPKESKSVKSLPDGKYTINITTLNKNEDIKSYLEDINLESKSIYTYNMSLGTKVLYGTYNTLKEATIGMNKLDRKVLDKKVYVDYMSKHRKLLEKHISIN